MTSHFETVLTNLEAIAANLETWANIVTQLPPFEGQDADRLASVVDEISDHAAAIAEMSR